jgi:thioredoxin reductase (NADPH)
LVLRDVETDATSELPVSGVFVAIGHDPNTKLFVDQIDLDPDGYVLTVPGTTQTSVPGVFAGGDVQDRTFRQAITAAGSGCMAALEAEHYLEALGDVSGSQISGL